VYQHRPEQRLQMAAQQWPDGGGFGQNWRGIGTTQARQRCHRAGLWHHLIGPVGGQRQRVDGGKVAPQQVQREGNRLGGGRFFQRQCSGAQKTLAAGAVAAQ